MTTDSRLHADDLGADEGAPLDSDQAGFVERLRQLIHRVGSANALARKAGVSQSGFQRYLAGGQPTRKVLIALAQAAEVDLIWLMTGEGGVQPRKPVDSNIQSLTRLPLYQSRATLPPMEPQFRSVTPQNVAGLGFCRFWLSSHGLDAKDIAGLYMQGNSMEPTINDGDTLLVNVTQRDIVDGSLYAIRDGNTALIKRIQRHPAGRLRLICDNPIYTVIEVETASVDIIGKVIWRGSLF